MHLLPDRKADQIALLLGRERRRRVDVTRGCLPKGVRDGRTPNQPKTKPCQESECRFFHGAHDSQRILQSCECSSRDRTDRSSASRSRTYRIVSNRGACSFDLRSRTLSSANAAGECARRNAQAKYSSGCSQINSGSCAAANRLAPTRPAKLRPRQVMTGTPAHSASAAVVWAL